MGEGLARVEIVERRLGVVHADDEGLHHHVLLDVGELRLVDLVDLVGRQVAVGAVERAVQERQDTGRGLLGRPEGDLLDRLGIVLPAEEVIVEDLHVEIVERPIACRNVLVGAGAGAVGGQPGLAPVAVLLVGLDGPRIDDADRRDGREERRIGGFELEAHGLRIDRRDVLRLQDLQERAGRRQAQGQHAAEGIDHVVGGHRAAVVELDAGFQLEFPEQAVFRDGVAGRQPGHDLRRVVLVAIEIVVGVQHHALHGHVEDLVRIEIARQGIAVEEGRGVGRKGALGQRRRRHGAGGERTDLAASKSGTH